MEIEIEFKHWLDELMDKYQDEFGFWLPISEWDADDLVDLEIIANGELQRREHERRSTH
jgi:hypothetical protein